MTNAKVLDRQEWSNAEVTELWYSQEDGLWIIEYDASGKAKDAYTVEFADIDWNNQQATRLYFDPKVITKLREELIITA